MLRVGTKVRLVQPVIEGEVVSRRLSDDSDDVQYTVAYVDANGDEQVRAFSESQIESLGEEAEEGNQPAPAAVAPAAAVAPVAPAPVQRSGR